MIAHRPKSVLITGASSGIGAALAAAYAEPGLALALAARDPGRLDAVAEACRRRGASVMHATVDVSDTAAVTDWIAEVDRAAPVELLIANAGVSAGTSGVEETTGFYGESEAQMRRILEINVNGVLNTVLPMIPRMRGRGRGQIALMSSLAGFRGLPGAAAYSASKAAVKSFGEALRGTLRREGIGVTVICPGFVRSRLTERNRFAMPMIMEAPAAARIIKRRLARNPPRIAFPFPIYALVWLLASLPPVLTDPMLARHRDRD